MIKGMIKKMIPKIVLEKREHYLITKNINDLFYKCHGYELDLKNPKTFNEKIQYRKFYGNNEFMAKIADKYLVRDYVKEKIGEEYLIPLLAVYDKAIVSDLEKLPNQFVIKTNHGSGSNHIEIITDKSKVDLKKLAKKMNKAIKEKFGYSGNELFYTLIPPKIIVEEYLKTELETPDDFKFHVFNKKNKIFLQIDYERYTNHGRQVYDSEFNLLDIEIIYPNRKKLIKKPKNYKKMIDLALKLSEDYDYCRVDLYNISEKIYFGEITNTHESGFGKMTPTLWDKKWGELWEIDNENKKLYK